MSSQSNYPEHIEKIIGNARIKLQAHGASLTIIIVTMIIASTICRSLMRRKAIIERRLTVISPSSKMEAFGQFISDAFAFVIFPSFVIGYVIINQWIIGRGKVYEGKVLTIGYFLHTGTGCIYFIAGALQFYTPLRQKYPRVHRCIGYVYYLMVILTSMGIATLAIKPHSGLSTQFTVLLFLPPWIWCNILSFRAIAIYRDVETHRQLNIVALSLATSIVAMRPLTFLVMMLENQWDFGRALALAVWIALVMSVAGSVLYVIQVYSLPTSRFPRLQSSGDAVVTGCSNCPLEDFVRDAVCITSFKKLDSRTLLLRLGSKNVHDDSSSLNSTTEGTHSPVFPINLSPGCHVALRIQSIVREFTPVVIGDADVNTRGTAEIIVRLVPNGKFSSLLISTLKLESIKSSITDWTRCSIPCDVYGPLFALPSRFGYLPYYGTDSPNGDRTIIMIGAGTGVTPFLSVINAALRNKGDQTILRLLSLSGMDRKESRDENTFSSLIESEISRLKTLSETGSQINQVKCTRFEGINLQKRFNVEMLDSLARGLLTAAPSDMCDPTRTVVWICGPPGFAQQCSVDIIKHTRLKRDQIFLWGVDDR